MFLLPHMSLQLKERISCLNNSYITLHITKKERKLTCYRGQGTNKLKIRVVANLSNTMQVFEKEIPAVRDPLETRGPQG